MKSLVVYFSKFGNTELVAKSIAEALKTGGQVELVAHDEVQPEHFSDADLVVMGTPTHRMNLPEVVRPLFDRLPRRILHGKAAAAFDTSYKMADRNSPAWLARFTSAPKLARKLHRLGGKRIVQPETFFVKGREGPLYEGELDRASVWASSLLSSMPSKLGRRKQAVAASTE